MKQINPRMQKLILLQTRATGVNAVIASCVCFGIGYAEYGATWEMCLLASFATIVLSKIMNILSLTFFQLKFYAGRFDEMESDVAAAAEILEQHEQAPLVQELAITILDTPKTPVGKYMDVEFFEWLDVKGVHGNPIRCVYIGTLPMDVAHLVPPGVIMIPPGILYQVETPNK